METTKMFAHSGTRDLKSVSKENVKSSQLTRLLVPASCHDYSWLVAHFNLACFIFPTMLSVGRRPTERKEETVLMSPRRLNAKLQAPVVQKLGIALSCIE